MGPEVKPTKTVLLLRRVWAIQTDEKIQIEPPFDSKDDAKYWLEIARREHPEQEHELFTCQVTDWEKVPNA